MILLAAIFKSILLIRNVRRVRLQILDQAKLRCSRFEKGSAAMVGGLCRTNSRLAESLSSTSMNESGQEHKHHEYHDADHDAAERQSQQLSYTSFEHLLDRALCRDPLLFDGLNLVDQRHVRG